MPHDPAVAPDGSAWAGFRRITFPGDTDFSQTRHLDRWDADGVRFVFGYDARANVLGCADVVPAGAWTSLARGGLQPPTGANADACALPRPSGAV